MISLHPRSSEEPFAPLDAVAREHRGGGDGQPWLLTNMIASADGATAVNGRSGQLGGPADSEMLVALRSVADVILVGADTVRKERYGRPTGTAESRAARLARGQQAEPLLAVVTASGRLDLDLPLFGSPDYRPLVLTSERAPAEQRTALEGVAEVLVLGSDRVDLEATLAALTRRGFGTVLSEGGPSFNGQLVAADLIDEWNLTISPLLAGGDSNRPAVWHGRPPQPPARMRLDRVWLGDELLFCRWLRAGSSPARERRRLRPPGPAS